jgi:uncharacterized protein
MTKIIKERYSPAEWNIYGAQSSDGDNVTDDNPDCIEILQTELLPAVQYFAYLEVGSEDKKSFLTDLTRAYRSITHEKFALRRATRPSDIYPVLHSLFEKRLVKTS